MVSGPGHGSNGQRNTMEASVVGTVSDLDQVGSNQQKMSEVERVSLVHSILSNQGHGRNGGYLRGHGNVWFDRGVKFADE